MPKTSERELVAAIADDFNTYIGKGVRIDPLVSDVDPELNVRGLDRLLRIHFVLSETGEDRIGVIDFVEALPERMRQLKTTLKPRVVQRDGEVRGRVDWQETVKRRYREGGTGRMQYACRETRKNYDIDENLVLKTLLDRIHGIVFDDLERALEASAGYEWLGPWVDDSANLAETFERVFRDNVYLQRIDQAAYEVTDRTIQSVERSRNPLYSEAAQLLGRYRRLMNYDLDDVEAKAILQNAFVRPERTEALFELYWVFRVLDCYEDVRFEVIEEGTDVVATWRSSGDRFVLYHDSTGSSALSFHEDLSRVDRPDEDGYFYRSIEVSERWRTLANDVFDGAGSDSLWGGRPDVVIERYAEGAEVPTEVLIGEVKYTANRSYAAQGLRELLEYMAFVRRGDDYFESRDDLLSSKRVKGILFVDRVERVSDSDDDVSVVTVGDELSRPV